MAREKQKDEETYATYSCSKIFVEAGMYSLADLKSFVEAMELFTEIPKAALTKSMKKTAP